MAETETRDNWDLTQQIIPYLDRHLAFPLLAHLAENEIFPQEQVTAAQYELAKGTNMVDYAVSLFQELHTGDPIPEGTVSHFFSLAMNCSDLCLSFTRICWEAGKSDRKQYQARTRSAGRVGCDRKPRCSSGSAPGQGSKLAVSQR